MTDSTQTNTLIHEKELKLKFVRSINCFFQTNKFLRAKMLEVVENYAKGYDKFLDVCCGIGFFAIHLAKLGKTIQGFDILKENIIFAKKNRQINNCHYLKFLTLASRQINPHQYQGYNIIVDPPRVGIDKKTRQTLTVINPQTIIYCSCNPATFARDYNDFNKTGYIINDLTLIDMFPGTCHIELVAQLVKD